METRYHALRAISLINKAAAVVVFLGSTLTFCAALQAEGAAFDTQSAQLIFRGVTVAAVMSAGAGFLWALGLWAFGELIMLFIHCEEHLRGMHNMMFYRQQQPAQPVAARRNLWEDG